MVSTYVDFVFCNWQIVPVRIRSAIKPRDDAVEHVTHYLDISKYVHISSYARSPSFLRDRGCECSPLLREMYTTAHEHIKVMSVKVASFECIVLYCEYSRVKQILLINLFPISRM